MAAWQGANGILISAPSDVFINSCSEGGSSRESREAQGKTKRLDRKPEFWEVDLF